MTTYVINGVTLGLTTTVTGVQRVCRELVYHLDELLEKETDIDVAYIYDVDNANIVINPSALKHIRTIPIQLPKQRWKRIISKNLLFRRVLRQNNAILCCFAFEKILYPHQISFIHDIRPVTTDYDIKSFQRTMRLYLAFQKKAADFILTGSDYQKNQIVKYFHMKDDSKVATVYLGYEHALQVHPDREVFKKYPKLRPQNYYYALGSLAPHKNFAWIAEVAKRNPDKVFAIAGGKDLKLWKDNVEVKGMDNLLFLGYVSDEENRALMENCIAFLHPSKYEGFGIPPLEALAYGAKIFISNATCLPEIYEDCAVYFDPDDYDVDLEEMGKTPVADPEKIFKKCSWDKAAEKLMEIFKEQANSRK